MYIIAVGVSHRRAPVEVREKLAFSENQLPALFERLKAAGNISGCVILSTCNRTEIYAVSRDIDAALSEIWNLLSAESGIEVDVLQDCVYSLTCQQAISHLFRVISGLDSMILGEAEILGQVTKAYQLSCENGANNSVMNVLFQKALKVGKQVQTETLIGTGASSVGAAAVELARQTFGDIENCPIMLIGTGEMGRLVARNLANNSASEVMVCNRSHDKAVEMAAQLGGCATPFEDMLECLPLVDVVVSCTAAPYHIITKEQMASVMEKRDNRPIFLIDLAVPRDIEPEAVQLERVHIFNVDDLQSIVDGSLNERKLEAQQAEIMVEEAVENFMKWLNSRAAIPAIRALCEKGEAVRDAELEKAMRKFGTLTHREEKILRTMANSIANKLTHAPIIKLRQQSQAGQGHLYARMLLELFDLQVRADDDDEREHYSDAVSEIATAHK